MTNKVIAKTKKGARFFCNTMYNNSKQLLQHPWHSASSQPL